MVRGWIKALLDRGLSPVTVNIHLRALRAAFNWLYREGYLAENPLERVRPLRVPRQYPKVLSEPEVLALLKTARSQGGWTGKRNWAMVLTFLDGMLRLSELINLELADVNLQARSIRVRHGKGDKERTVFMGRRLTRAMREWLSVRGHVPGCDNVFISRGGSPLDKRNVQRILERLAAKAGLGRVSPHMLRHTGATLFVRNGGDPFSLQQLLGHSSITTTQIYVHMAGTALREAHARASPVDRLLEGR
jgi:site-specific recombinase XerD